jgi:hypothetical protein
MAIEAILVILGRVAVMNGYDVLPRVYLAAIIFFIRKDIRTPGKKIQTHQYANSHFPFAKYLLYIHLLSLPPLLYEH